MNPFTLQDMTIRSEKVLDRLRVYLNNISCYPNFDPGMQVRIFVTSDGDFTAFEAVDYRLGFTSTDHKLMETIKSNVAPVVVDYVTFVRLVNAL